MILKWWQRFPIRTRSNDMDEINMNESKNKTCLISLDVEEWFQVENFKGVIKESDWPVYTSSVLKNTQKLLLLFKKYDVRATFFLLGWIAEKLPELLTEIISSGHEIASHGYGHTLINKMKTADIMNDISKSKNIIEEITNTKVWGYRAPSFSINDELIEILGDLGFAYDSSYNPFSFNDRYGTLNTPMENVKDIFQLHNNLYEIPVSSVKILNKDIPISGGAYFRLIPFTVFKRMVKAKLKKVDLYTFYLHPWEIEPEQPRIKNIPLNYRIRHYTGLSRTKRKLEKLIIFLKQQGCQFLTMSDYIQQITK